MSSVADINQDVTMHILPPFNSFLLVAYRAPHLVVFCDSGVELYDADHAKWMQTIPIRKVCVCVCVRACVCVPTVANWLCALALMPLLSTTATFNHREWKLSPHRRLPASAVHEACL